MMLRQSFRTMVAIVAMATAFTASITSTAQAAHAAAPSNCDIAVGSSDGHVVTGHCFAGTGTRYWIVAQFCTPSRCSSLGGNEVAYGSISYVRSGTTAFWNRLYRYCANDGSCTAWRR